jgi:hypothetical protein
MRNLRLKAIGCLIAAAALPLPAFGAASSTPSAAYPGMLNYVEGQASIGNGDLTSNSIGVAQLQPGQTLTTRHGRAEVLLIPGAFLRVGNNSKVKMISPDLTNTEIGVESGEATVEVTDLHHQNDLRVKEGGATARIEKNGFYDFDANSNLVRVVDGQAKVEVNDHTVKVKGDHELNVAAVKPKPQKFDKKAYEDSSLYKWSSLRSAYVAEANADLAPTYIVNGAFAPGWIGAGWYWSPWFNCYTFVPVGGVFYSPFGWGFYSPFWAYNVGLYGAYSPHHVPHRFSPDPHRWGPVVRTPPLKHGHIRGIAPTSPLRTNPRGFGRLGMGRGLSHPFHPAPPRGFRPGTSRGFHGPVFRGHPGVSHPGGESNVLALRGAVPAAAFRGAFEGGYHGAALVHDLGA